MVFFIDLLCFLTWLCSMYDVPAHIATIVMLAVLEIYKCFAKYWRPIWISLSEEGYLGTFSTFYKEEPFLL